MLCLSRKKVNSNDDIRRIHRLFRIVALCENQENQRCGRNRTLERPALTLDNLQAVSLTDGQKLEGYFWFLEKALDYVGTCSTAECLAKLDTCWTFALTPIERETLLALATTDSFSSTNSKSKLSEDLENVQPMRVESLSKIVGAVLSPAMDAIKSGVPTPDFPNEFCLYSPISNKVVSPPNNFECTDIHQKETSESGSDFAEIGSESGSDEDIFCNKFSFYHYIQEADTPDRFEE